MLRTLWTVALSATAALALGPAHGPNAKDPKTLWQPAPVTELPATAPDDWTTVPVKVVSRIDVPATAHVGWQESTMRHSVKADGEKRSVHVTDGEWHSGKTLDLVFDVDAEGVPVAWTRATEYSDVGGEGVQPIVDMVGTVEIEQRASDAETPVRIRYDLVGIRVLFDQLTPWHVTGAVELDHTQLPWSAAFEPGSRSASELDEVPRPTLLTWQSGMPRAYGHVDARGLRVGLWTTWWPSGARQSVTEFVDGRRAGKWRAFGREGAAKSEGQLVGGEQHGAWKEFTRRFDVPAIEAGSYAQGAKDGRWTVTLATGVVVDEGAFAMGREVGVWTDRWPNGEVRRIGDYDEFGDGRVRWKRWNERGEYEGERLEAPPWLLSLGDKPSGTSEDE